jgi:hypothetical protein
VRCVCVWGGGQHNNNIGDDGAKILAQALLGMTGMKNLYLVRVAGGAGGGRAGWWGARDPRARGGVPAHVRRTAERDAVCGGGGVWGAKGRIARRGGDAVRVALETTRRGVGGRLRRQGGERGAAADGLLGGGWGGGANREEGGG